MKKNQIIFALLATTGLFLTSCATARQVEVQPSPSVVSPTKAIAPTTPTTAPTVAPPATVPPTSAIVLTPTSASVVSESSGDALDKVTFVRTLLTTTVQCELPCWWGIRPGDAFTSTNIEPITKTLIYSSTDQLFTISVNYSDKDNVPELAYQVAVAVAISDTSVSEIRVHGGNDLVLPPGTGYTFGNDWQEYAPPQILTKLGVPTDIRLYASTLGNPEGIFFTIDLLYPDKGIAVHYDGFAHKRGAQFLICPSMAGGPGAGIDGILSMDLLLTSPSNLDEFNASLSRWKPYKVDNTSPIQEAIGKSVTEFADMFSKTTPDACFEAPNI